ncbi:flagellar assembly protein FliH [Azospirillum thiophilum]|uniref:Flagellar assembly protein FliH n=1 Tax=Azospirillum thiophilum TaxID=528244 RepID=A0AAC8W1F9_9PROT|nr:FliH/SctL family protein [Azospirillum thiophilum]ALG73409.1 flagellar assembly protein FliH [Azospirillum thiophilum]KJR62804.1 flagellar assembly protein FliH [Azospirillum thiophilum]
MSVRKFLFDESFDVDAVPRMTHVEEDDLLPEDEPPQPEEPPPPPAPIFGEEELAAARAQGYDEGLAAGKSEGTAAGYGKGFTDGMGAGQNTGYERGKAEIEATVNNRIAGALSQIADGVARLLAEHEAGSAARSEQPVHLALAIVRKLMPEWARRGGMVEVEGMVRACLTDLIDEPRLVIRVADDTMDLVREHLDRTVGSRGFGAKLMVVGDPSIAPGGCRIEWAEGGMERDTAQLLAEIERRAAHMLEAPAPV